MLLLLILISCDLEVKKIEPSLSQHVSSLNHEARIRGIDINLYGKISIEYAENIKCDGLDNVRGCAHSNGDIYIDYMYNNIAPDLWTEMIVYHEIGHAYFGLDHEEGNSLMNPKFLFSKEDKSYYKEHRKEILDKYFGVQ